MNPIAEFQLYYSLPVAYGKINDAKKTGFLNLNNLNLTPDNLKNLIPKIKEIPSIKQINLGNNKLSTLPKEIGELTNIESLFLSGNKIENIPKEITDLTKLKNLSLIDNKIESIPPEIRNLTNLDNLALSENKIKSIPPEIGELTKLKELYLNDNQIKSIPQEIGKLENLNFLYLSNNQIKDIPPEIGDLTMLKFLNLGYNQITSIPQEIGKLKNLKELDINSNQINTITEGIGDLTGLKTLSLQANTIKNLPDSIGNLTNLESLFLNHNEIESIPLKIGDLTKLRILHLNDNEIKSLPPEISKLTTLNILNLQKNKLETVPEVLVSNSPGLKARINLNLSENQIPDETIEKLRGYFTNLIVLVPKNNLTKIYGKDYANIEKKIRKLDLGDFSIEGGTKSSKQVINQFLKKLPLNDVNAKEIYIPAAKKLIDTVLNTELSKEERQGETQKIATSLGNCATPVKTFLTQAAIGQNVESKGHIPDSLNDLVVAMAVEKKIKQKFKDHLKGPESAELVQGLLNSLFLEGSENHEINKVKIEGERNRIPSATQYVDFAYNMATDKIATDFAEMCCKTNEKNGVIKNTESKYELDPMKVEAMVVPFHKELGLISEKNKVIDKYADKYKNKIEEVLRNSDLAALYYDQEEAIPLIDSNGLTAEFRTILQNIPEKEMQSALDNQLKVMIEKIETVEGNCREAEKKEEKIDMSLMTQTSAQSINANPRTERSDQSVNPNPSIEGLNQNRNPNENTRQGQGQGQGQGHRRP